MMPRGAIGSAGPASIAGAADPDAVFSGPGRHPVCDGELEPAGRDHDHHQLHGRRSHPVDDPESHGNEFHAHGCLPVQRRAGHAELHVEGLLAETDLRWGQLHTGPAAGADGRRDHQQHPVPERYPIRRHLERCLDDLRPHQRGGFPDALKTLAGCCEAALIPCSFHPGEDHHKPTHRY